MKYFLLVTCSLFSLNLSAQVIPNGANIIVIKDVGFIEVCNALLDSGYNISKKDNELHTVSTESKEYKKLWNASYKINIRIKDSVAYVSGTVTSPPNGSGLFVNEPVFNHTSAKGKTFPKSLYGYAFNILNNFALGFRREVSYEKR